MSTTEAHDYLSAVFIGLLQPIADLCDRMLQLDCGEPNEVQTSPMENGYAVSIIALAVFLLEGACGRARFISGSNQKQCSAAKTLRDFGRNDLAEKVEEIFVVRDAIAHAHLWKAKILWTKNDLRFAQPPVRLPGYGDKKFQRVVDLNSRTTRQLKLDVFPTRIHRRTAVIALKECAKALQFLESTDRRIVYLTPQPVRVGGRFIPFYQWVRELATG
jgi:hypothetical protein